MKKIIFLFFCALFCEAKIYCMKMPAAYITPIKDKEFRIQKHTQILLDNTDQLDDLITFNTPNDVIEWFLALARLIEQKEDAKLLGKAKQVINKKAAHYATTHPQEIKKILELLQ